MNKKDENGQNYLVLIVEDEEQLSEIYRIFFESEGIPCITAKTVEEATDILRHKRISLILLDWRLKESGGMRTGGEVLKFCRELYPLMPVIVMTGVAPQDQDVRTDAVMAGADGFLHKPFSAALLTTYVERWLNRQHLTSEWSMPQEERQILPLEEVKRRYSQHVVGLLKGNVSLAATKLQVHRHTLAGVVNSANDPKH